MDATNETAIGVSRGVGPSADAVAAAGGRWIAGVEGRRGPSDAGVGGGSARVRFRFGIRRQIGFRPALPLPHFFSLFFFRPPIRFPAFFHFPATSDVSPISPPIKLN